MIFNSSSKYRNIAIAVCTFLAINTLKITSDRAFASEKTTIYIAQNKSNNDRISIEKLLKDNLLAYKEENITALMDSVHPDSPARAQTEEFSKIAFDMYDIDYEYTNLEIIEISESEATIQVTQTTKKINGPDFKDNRATSIQTLKKYDGKWKFFNLLAITNIEYLN